MKKQAIKIKVVLIKPLKKPEIVEIGSDLKSMQGTVGGLIESLCPFDEEVALVCNEEGKLIGLPYNRVLTGTDGKVSDVIAGDFFICGAKDEDFESLTDEQAKRYSEMFNNPVYFYKMDNELRAIPIF